MAQQFETFLEIFLCESVCRAVRLGEDTKKARREPGEEGEYVWRASGNAAHGTLRRAEARHLGMVLGKAV